MNIKKVLFLLFLILPFSGIYAKAVIAENGILDVCPEDISRIIPLTGEWEFRNKEGISQYLTVPGSWERVTGYNYGRGIYSLTIINNNPSGGEMALLLPKLNQNIRLYIDGILAYDSVSENPDVLRFARSVIPVPREERILLEVAMDNTYFYKGGMNHSFQYGPYSQILQKKYIYMIGEAAFSGILLVLFLYNLFLFLGRIYTVSSFYLSIISLVFCVRGLMTGEVMIEILFPCVAMETAFRWDYILLYLGALFIILFICNIYQSRKELSKIISIALCSAGGLLALFSLIVPLPVLSRSIFVLESYGLAVIIFCLAKIVAMIVRRERNSRILFIGILLFFTLVCYNIYSISRGVILFETLQLGLLLFLLSNFMVLTIQFGKSHHQVKQLSRELEQEVARQTEELRQLSRTDPLTGINNRRRFTELGEREVAIHSRYGRPLSLIMMDLDHFKRINDEYGHSTGDRALIYMAKLCLEEIRESDILGRLGGEEFALILLETDLPEAAAKGERIRARLEKSTGRENHDIPPMTVSMGIIRFGRDESLEGALERSDRLLYRAKSEGRNRVVAGCGETDGMDLLLT